MARLFRQVFRAGMGVALYGMNMNTIQAINQAAPQQDACPVRNATTRAHAEQDARPVRNTAVRSQAEQDTRPVRQAAQNSQSSKGNASTTPEPSFSLLLGQLLGTAEQAASAPLPQQQDEAESGKTNTIALPDAQAAAAAKQAAQPASALPQSLLGAQGVEIAAQAQDSVADSKFTDLLAKAGNDQSNPPKPTIHEPGVQDKTAGPDTHADAPKQAVSFPVQTDAGKQDKAEIAVLTAAEKTASEQQPLPAKNSSAQPANDIVSAAQHNASAIQAQTVHSIVSAAPLPADGNLHVQPAVMDPADAFENTVTIIRDGNRLAVKLEPDGLGKLDINLSLDQGKVHAQINVQDSATKTLIENNMQQIVDALLKDGMSVGGFSVSLQQGKGWDLANGQQGPAVSEKAAIPAAIVQAASRPVAQGIVNIFV